LCYAVTNTKKRNYTDTAMASAKRKPDPTTRSTRKPRRSNTSGKPETKNNAETIQLLPVTEDTNFLDLFQRLQEATPRDANGFLQYLLDPSHVPQDLDQRPQQKQAILLQTAQLPLSMMEGYHSFESNRQPRPVWTQLPHEPPSYYQAFRQYLLSPNRSLTTSADDLDFDSPGFSAYTIREAYILFYWHDRARSYDILKPVAAARLRDQRILLTEDAHYILTNNVLKQLGEEIEERSNDQDGRPWAGLKASEIVAALSTMMQMQRVSLGLPSHGPKLKDAGFQPAPFSGTDRAIRESSQNYLGTSEAGLTQAEKMQQDINRALAENPDAAAALQAAAIEVLLKARSAPRSDTGTEVAHAHPPGYGPPPTDGK
jgi:hypothetical protein